MISLSGAVSEILRTNCVAFVKILMSLVHMVKTHDERQKKYSPYKLFRCCGLILGGSMGLEEEMCYEGEGYARGHACGGTERTVEPRATGC